MGEEHFEPEDAPERDPLVRQSSLKLLEQRLTIKLIVGFTAAGGLAHLDIPTGLTAGAALLVGTKLLLARLSL